MHNQGEKIETSAKVELKFREKRETSVLDNTILPNSILSLA